MADDNDIKFTLDLDNTDFIDKGKQAFDVISKIGSPENLSGLISGLQSTTLILGTVAVAAYAFKEAIDLTVEGEQIKLVEQQFETLATQAGLSASELKEGMEGASHGLLSTNELLQASNKYIVEMGSSAKRLPEIMELARKATMLFGGDLMSNFNNIAQAMAAGNARMLRHYGIIVDTTAATQKYAAQLGIETNELSEAGKRQAIMNEALEAGKTAFSGVNANVETSSMAWQKFKSALNEVKDVIAVIFEKYLGPPLRQALQDLGIVAERTALILKSSFGDGAQKAEASLKLVQMRIDETKKKIQELEDRKVKLGFDPAIGETNSLNQSLIALQAQYDKLASSSKKFEEQKKQDEKAAQGSSAQQVKQDQINQEERKKNEQKFQEELLAIQKKTDKEKEQSVNSVEQIEEQVRKQDEEKERTHQQNIAKIKAEHQNDEKKQKALIDAEDKRYHAEQENREREDDKLREKLMQNYQSNSTNVFNGIGRAADNTSKKAKADMSDFGKRGQEVMDSFKNRSTQAFESIGQGIAANQNVAQAASQAMKAMFLNMIADRAEAEGQMLLLSSIWPPNPVGMAAGGALIALGAALHSMAGSAGGISIGGGGGGSAGVGSADTGVGSSSDNSQSQQQLSQQQQPVQRSVNVNIAGNYLNTSESQRTIMELMRAESDSTDFTYNKIGV